MFRQTAFFFSAMERLTPYALKTLTKCRHLRGKLFGYVLNEQLLYYVLNSMEYYTFTCQMTF